ncbi:hypothetical protein [Chitinophaga filiformis]|uniref:Uncharacterized protein n=1 Tax=Chitinophaga filiformis TaxID=104663 RepID=A0ABY4I7P9_CHIFI|nr:hypothetical protein [Chitinophaga filiformis]UPK72109.1 hypothetical protein MYF79_12520 [Chitinophaga filiformis]
MSTKKLQIKKRVVCKCKAEERPVLPKNNRDAKTAPDTTVTIPPTGFTTF